MQESQENQEDPKIYSERPKYDVSGGLIESDTENDFLRAYRRSQGQNKNLYTGGVESFEVMNVNASGGGAGANLASPQVTDITIIDLTTGDPIDGTFLFSPDD
jgi:hypothetical protein